MKQLKAYLLLIIAIAIGCPTSYGASENNSFMLKPLLSADSLDLMSKEPYMVPYVKYLMNSVIPLKDKDKWSYTLVYIDNDDIPEMFVRCDHCFPVPQYVLSQHDGIVSSIEVRKGVDYIEREGLLLNSDGGQGESREMVYRLGNGQFELTANASSVLGPDLDLYYFNGAEVDEETVERQIMEAFYDKGPSVSIEELEWKAWKDLLNHKESIKGWK